MTNTKVVNSDGTALLPYRYRSPCLELDKLADNIALARGGTGVRDVRYPYNENFSGFRFTRIGGTTITI